MKRMLLLTATHVVALAIGFAGGIYLLPILIAPDAPSKAEVATHEKELAQARQKERDALVRAPQVQDPAPAARAEQDKES